MCDSSPSPRRPAAAHSARSSATTPTQNARSRRLASEHGHAPTTLDALVAVHLAHMRDAGRSATTLRRYDQLWRTWLAPSLGAIAPGELHRVEVERALTAMHNAGQSERSIHQAAIVLNTTFRWACDQQLTRVNPVIGSELPNRTTITATRHR